VQAYVELRSEARNNQETTFTSPRSLLAILRLSTALARLRMGDEVTEDDVAEAIRLVERSRDSIRPGTQTHAQRNIRTSEQIHQLIRKMKTALPEGDNALRVKDIRTKCIAAGFTNEQLDKCLDEYETTNNWHINQNRTKLTFVS